MGHSYDIKYVEIYIIYLYCIGFNCSVLCTHKYIYGWIFIYLHVRVNSHIWIFIYVYIGSVGQNLRRGMVSIASITST